jgi:hypothetical protein
MQVNDKKIKHALIKVGLTPNRICDIWVIILRRNVMYLYSKNSSNHIRSFDSEKVEEGIFYYRDNISSNEWHIYCTHQKSYLWLVVLQNYISYFSFSKYSYPLKLSSFPLKAADSLINRTQWYYFIFSTPWANLVNHMYATDIKI